MSLTILGSGIAPLADSTTVMASWQGTADMGASAAVRERVAERLERELEAAFCPERRETQLEV